MRIQLLASWAIVLLAASPASAQQSDPTGSVRDPGGKPALTPAAQGKGVLSGVVTTAAGQPAAGARVSLFGVDVGNRMATTDAKGEFTFDGLRTGRYNVSVSKPGYVTLSYGQRRVGGPGTQIPIADGERQHIAMLLPKAAVITGMVLDERGEPAMHTSVRAMRYSLVSGRRRAQQAGQAETDDRGIYRIHSLQPGEYGVCAQARNMGPMNEAQRVQQELEMVRRSIESAPSPAMRQQMVDRLAVLQAQRPPPQEEPTMGYAPVCFPVSSAGPSTTVTVAAGEERSGIDIQMTLTPVARIEGSIVAPGGGVPRNVNLTLVNAEDSEADISRYGSGVDQGGRFNFQNVAPGRYRLMARTMRTGPMGPQVPPGQSVAEEGLWASLDVAVSGQNLLDVVLELRPGLTLSGQVVFQGTTHRPPDPNRIQVSLLPSMTEGTSGLLNMGPPPQGKVDGNGVFTLANVVPGRYRLSAGVVGVQGWVVDSITAGGQDVLDSPMDITGSRDISGIVITFGDRVTELSGTIATGQGQPATEPTILLYPTDQKYWTPGSRRIRTTRAAADGSYTFRLVPPGEYRLATLIDPEPGSWFDRELLEQLDATSIRVVLGEGEKKVENLKVK